ncbi:hypothetical protein KIH32_23180 [Pseudomonas fluorescens]|uniref:hypothetical protein n=1 Tax=Pseudomonas fluorescens TaxID=294 RepID=UPI001BDA9F14|nr:hypothetical protein [Pseudomonas fluorescens]MBT0626820.1 hypothetical protein [Pseudomonas fluorescens]
METLVSELVSTSSQFLIRNAIPALPPLIVVDALPGTGGMVPLTTAERDLRIRIPALPQPGPAGAQPTIRVYAELPPPHEHQVIAYLRLPSYPTADIDMPVPRRFVSSEGDYLLTYILEAGDNVLCATASTPLRVHKTPPFGYLTITPPAPLLPLNLATAMITEEYLASNDPVVFRIPEHAEINTQVALRVIPYYGITDRHMQFPFAPPGPVTLPDYPAPRVLSIPASVIRERGNGLMQLTYRFLDRLGNRSRDSLILELRVALQLTPSNIAAPRVTQAIAPDNTVTQADIDLSGQGGMEVWLDSVTNLQINDAVAVVVGTNTVLAPPVVYVGQPLPLRLVITTAQLLAILPGAVSNNTPTQIKFRITRGTTFVEGPTRNIILNFSPLMTLAQPQVLNLIGGNLTCASPQPTSLTFLNRSIGVFIPPSALLRANTAGTLTCVMSRQDDGSIPIAPPLTFPIVWAASASTTGQTVYLQYSATMRVIGRGIMYLSYTTQNAAGQLLQSPPTDIPVRGVLPGNTYCDGAPFIPTP